MCRYAWHNYRDHFACFESRKSFKCWQWAPVDESTFGTKQRLTHVPREIVCPDGKQPMVDMGLDFKAPPKNDIQQWQILHALYEHGFTFHGCGCYVGFNPPRTLREVPEWIEKHRSKSEAERLLGKYEARRRSQNASLGCWPPRRIATDDTGGFLPGEGSIVAASSVVQNR